MKCLFMWTCSWTKQAEHPSVWFPWCHPAVGLNSAPKIIIQQQLKQAHHRDLQLEHKLHTVYTHSIHTVNTQYTELPHVSFRWRSEFSCYWLHPCSQSRCQLQTAPTVLLLKHNVSCLWWIQHLNGNIDHQWKTNRIQRLTAASGRQC